MTHIAIVIGAGSYVIGDSYGPGVILPTLIDSARRGELERIVLVTRTARDAAFWERVDELKALLDAGDIQVDEHVASSPAALTDLPLDPSSRGFVAVPDAHHAEHIELFLSAGVPTWSVKPMTGSGAESRRLHRRALDEGVPLWIDYHKRFDDSNRKLKSLVSTGEIGRLLMLSVQYSQPWRLPLHELSAWASDVDVFQYIGCHYVDLVFYLYSDAVPTRVSATGLPGRLSEEGGPAFDVVHAVIDFAVGGETLRTDFQVGWNDPTGSSAKSHQRLDLTFARGRVIVDQKERGFQVWRDSGFEHINPHFFQILPDGSAGRNSVAGYGPESIRRFLTECDDLDRGAPSAPMSERTDLPWSAQAWRTDEVVDGVRASLHAAGAWISMDAAPFATT